MDSAFQAVPGAMEMEQQTLPYHFQVSVRKREDLNAVEDFVRYLQKTSCISNRCPLLETSNYMHMRIQVLHWIALEDKTLWNGNGKVCHLGDRITMRVFYDSDRKCLNVEVDGHLQGDREGLPMVASVDVEKGKKATKNSSRSSSNSNGRTSKRRKKLVDIVNEDEKEDDNEDNF